MRARQRSWRLFPDERHYFGDSEAGQHKFRNIRNGGHSGMVRQHQTRNLEIPGSMLRIAPE
jgi:hypothetical protein